MKFLILVLYIIPGLNLFGQKSTSKISTFRLSFSFYNHAERIFNGTTIYLLTESSIKVKKLYWAQDKSKIIYSKKFKNSDSLLNDILRIKLDSLKDFYVNWCVMPTSGNEYYLEFKNDSTSLETHLHHYYLRQINDIAKIINSNLPKKYRLIYLLENTDQGCTFLTTAANKRICKSRA